MMKLARDRRLETPCTVEQWQAEADLCFGGSLEALYTFLQAQAKHHWRTMPIGRHLNVCRDALGRHLRRRS